MIPDLEELSLKDLQALRAKVDRAIETYEERVKLQAHEELLQVAKKFGFGLAELVSVVPAKGSRGTVAPKYANPENPAQTWTGRGRKPKWVEVALAEGKTLEDLSI